MLFRKLLPAAEKRGAAGEGQISSNISLAIVLSSSSVGIVYFQSCLVLMCALIKLRPLGYLCSCIVAEMGLS